MDNSFHLGLSEYLILAWAMFCAFWMSRAPKSLLTLMGLKYETESAFIVGCVRWFGRHLFFVVVFGVLVLSVPNRISRNPAYSLAALLMSLAISIYCLRRPKLEQSLFNNSQPK